MFARKLLTLRFRMLIFHLSSATYMPNTLLSSRFDYVMECPQFQSRTTQSNYRVSLVKIISPSVGFLSFFTGLDPCRALRTSVNTGETSHAVKWYEQKLRDSSSDEQISTKEIQLDMYSNSVQNFGCEGYKETESERRRKIGLANKGRVPWNRGRKHSAETREKIKQRTKEAMRDPKVRKKMSECPRTHSNQTKARIGSSLRQLWGERLKWKRSREKFLISWVESIAKAAKKGGVDQEELDWDSYDKMEREIALQQLQWAAEKAKEMARIRAERAARVTAGKMARVAQKRKEREHTKKVTGEIKRKTRTKPKEEEEDSAVVQELNLKARLTKIHRKKSINNQVTSQDHRTWEAFDLEFVKRERLQKEVSLAEQIRAAKNKRAEFVAREALTSSSSVYPFTADH